MNSGRAGAALLLALIVVASASANDDDLAVGEKLYVSQCKICHGNVSAQTSDRAPLPSQRLVHVAMRQSAASTMQDISGLSDVTVTGAQPGQDAAEVGRIAFAPPFGPNLRGVYGRAAGSVKGFDYSTAFLKSLKGMEWNDAALDVWIASPQAWVPGVYMFYKQPDPEIRRKIILYLKSNP
jgi:cytochrome c2